MTVTAMAYGDPPPRNPHIGLVTSTDTANLSFTTQEGNVPSTPAPLINGGITRITLNGVPLTGVSRECGVELAEPDIPINEARRIARHRQRSIERELGDD